MDGIDPRGEFLLIWIITFTVLTSLVLVLRFWSACLIRRPFAADDFFVILSYMGTMTEAGFSLWALKDGGVGKAGIELDPSRRATLAKLIYTASIVWLLGIVFAKLSMLCLYIRIFTLRKFQWKAYAAIGLTVAYGITFLGIFIMRCSPISAFWNPQPGYWCRGMYTNEFTSVSFSLVIDLAIILLPMPLLWGLQMNLTKRLALTAMFSISLTTIGIMSWRLAQTSYALHHLDDDYYSTTLPVLLLVVMLELWLGVIVACIPTLAPVLNRLLAPLIASITRRTTAGSKPLRAEHAIVTIGQKPSRKRYYEMARDLDPLAMTLGGNEAEAECVVGVAVLGNIASGAVHVENEV
ncbi:hypothetical protein F5Y14DRAFT_384680 [Nemania sp. NC0429]|nr:hypothetical protein F5Y14DRAFT_384680 [Nemania sp. NC0429]